MSGFFSPGALLVVLLLGGAPVRAQQQAVVELFTPEGTVKKVRQVRARFSQPIVPLGDPRIAVSPFDIRCGEQGTERWVDERNWVYDFDRDLPAGVRCEFSVRDGLRTLTGLEIGGRRQFLFSTGGPAIISSDPGEGSSHVDEEQVFILALDGEPTEASVLQNVSFAIDGVAGRVGARIVSGPEAEALIKASWRYRRTPQENLLLIRCPLRFPPATRVSLVWGRGVSTRSGVATMQDQVLPFVTRPRFAASFHCQKINPDADCVPLTAMRLNFSASVLWESVRGSVLTGPGGRSWKPKEIDAQASGGYINSLEFGGPFPEQAGFQLAIPAGIVDDAGRPLANADRFPLSVRTDEYPPLVKFPAHFGILELKGAPLLPVTLRNVEPDVAARLLEAGAEETRVDRPRAIDIDAQVAARIGGKIHRVPPDKAGQMLYWIKKISNRRWGDREIPLFDAEISAKTKPFSIPKLEGAKAFEIVGIPLPEPGFYVVEIESELLGAALLGRKAPMYVPTSVVVTNLSVHFKWGLDSSLVWVTTLDRGEPVRGAEIHVRDCEGAVLWQGATDRDGIGRMAGLPPPDRLGTCGYDALDQGLLITAQKEGDLAFAHSSWDDGIEPWRYRLPTEWRSNLVTAHTIFDRPLFRAGETVHMKHVLRKRSTSGLAHVPAGERAGTAVVRHLGTGQEYPLALRWDEKGISESSWTIPKEAKLGHYSVHLAGGDEEDSGHQSGTFRVEEYRVPLMKGLIRPPPGDLVAPSRVPLDITVSYLAGGAAGGLPIRLRHQAGPGGTPPPEGFEDFVFSNGTVREGVFRLGEAEEEPRAPVAAGEDFTLDTSGSVRASIPGLPEMDRPMSILAEVEFKDPNGEIQTVSSRIQLWPADRLIGMKPGAWQTSQESVELQVALTDLRGKPAQGVPVKVDLFQRKTYSHRKRLVGGFYAYEHSREVRRIESFCEGVTDAGGLVRCGRGVPLSGNLILQATARDSAGRGIAANRDIWVAGKEAWWFQVEDSDRIDVIPESARYEPGDIARFQVRMPFREATALITVEREGVGETFVRKLSGNEPVVEIPIRREHAPNVYVSVLAVRGRASEVQPTATVDLGRPAYKLGIASIDVGWKAQELKVKVSADRVAYKVRQKARVRIEVRTADGGRPPGGTEVAVAAVDEGLLELMPNQSWQLLEAMMGSRSYGVRTSTAQMHVVGKRHFGLKALPEGGGGGKQGTRELFDTLLLWKGRLALDAAGRAEVEVPLNDSITSFRIVAVAAGGTDRFGTGSTSIRSTQDLVIFSGIPPLVREGDEFRAQFTLRNATDRKMDVQVSGKLGGAVGALALQAVGLAAGESREIGWPVRAPSNVQALAYEIEARVRGGESDRLAVTQKVLPAVPVRTLQATLEQLDGRFSTGVAMPDGALPGRGGVRVSLRPRLVDGMEGVEEHMRRYPYICLEQLVSKAVALQDAGLWSRLMDVLPTYLDGNGLAKYFPSMRFGNDSLTAYVLAIAHEAGLAIPAAEQGKMRAALAEFVEGRIGWRSSLPTADLSIRKIAALEALSRYEPVGQNRLDSISIAPNLWPTSAVIDWVNLLGRMTGLRGREARSAEAEQILRSRLSYLGGAMVFSTERSDRLWWLMVSADVNAVRLVLSRLDSAGWRGDLPRMIRGAIGRQRRGHWDTTTANAWGVLALRRFSAAFERTPVTGRTSATLADGERILDWGASPAGGALDFPWPAGEAVLGLEMNGTGKPWAVVQSLAALPLKEPITAGFKVRKTVTAVQRRDPQSWSAGDIVRVRLEVEAQSDMTWVVVNDPIPAGASILGTGLGRDSDLLTRDETRKGWVWPAFEERSLEAFRVYYEYVPKGEWRIEYTCRLNNPGVFQAPPTRVEALYFPEMFCEIPNEAVRVK